MRSLELSSPLWMEVGLGMGGFEPFKVESLTDSMKQKELMALIEMAASTKSFKPRLGPHSFFTPQ